MNKDNVATVSTDHLPPARITAKPGTFVLINRYTRRRLEQEHEAMRAEIQEMRRRLISASLKWKRRTKIRMFALRLMVGMLLSENQELRETGRELALMTGHDRSRRYAERHSPEKLREAVTDLWEDASHSDGRWSVAAAQAGQRETAKWN